MPSFAARAVTGFLRASRANATFVDAEAARRHIDERRIRPRSFAPPKNLRGVTITLERQDGWPVFTVVPAKSRPTGGFLYVHGGAWVNEIVSQHWHLIAEIAASANVTVVVPIYPLVPFGTAQSVVARIVELFLAMRDTYGRATIGGDSAGGQIALSAVEVLLAEHGVTPDVTLLISPALDLSFDNPDIPVVQPSDPWLARPGGLVFADAWRERLPVDDPRASPLFGVVSGLGPIAMFSGTRDILNPDARLLARSLRAIDVDLRYFEAARQVHVYPLLPTPEGRDARRSIVDQVRRTVA